MTSFATGFVTKSFEKTEDNRVGSLRIQFEGDSGVGSVDGCDELVLDKVAEFLSMAISISGYFPDVLCIPGFLHCNRYETRPAHISSSFSSLKVRGRPIGFDESF